MHGRRVINLLFGGVRRQYAGIRFQIEAGQWNAQMTAPFGPNAEDDKVHGQTRRSALGLILGAPLLAGCAGLPLGAGFGTASIAEQPPGPAGPAQESVAVGAGQVKVGLILPLSGAGNAGVAGNSMKNAAELALAEFHSPDVQLLIKDDGATANGAQQAAQQALNENVEIILGPLFGLSVPATAQFARARNVPVIAFSTDSSVAGRGVYLLSFLPESDVNRIVDYAVSTGKRSFAALLPENAYGNVVEGRIQAGRGTPRRTRCRIRKIFDRSGADADLRAQRGAGAWLRGCAAAWPMMAIPSGACPNF